jgi:tyrosyl-tRNA synthetase
MSRSNWDLVIDKIYPSKSAFVQAAKQPLRIYFGVDPTSSVIHLGNAVPLRILRLLQEEGHTIILLFGSFTAQIGDPTGRDQTRPELSSSEIASNVASYREQVIRILDPKRTLFRDNTEWWQPSGSAGSLQSFLELGRRFTSAQLLERDMFQERIKQGRPVTITELIYPMIQAYDSVMLDVDVELGGTDQTFNMLAGRTLMKQLKNKEKFVITTKLLVGTDGRKMSKSYGNTINVIDEPASMFGKLMSVPDTVLPEYCALAAGIDPEEHELKALIEQQPRAAKAKMAYEVVAFYHGVEAAELASRAFDRQFRDKEQPESMVERWPSVSTQERLTFFLVDLAMAGSKAEAARLIQQGAVHVDGTIINDQFAVLTPVDGMVIQVGKRQFVRLTQTS